MTRPTTTATTDAAVQMNRRIPCDVSGLNAFTTNRRRFVAIVGLGRVVRD